MNNMKSMLKVASIFKDETDVNINNNSNRTNQTTNTTNNIQSISGTNNNQTYNQNEPNFFL